MATCSRCGNSITFRYVDGRCVPLHLSGGCIDSGDRASFTNYSGYSRSEESCCFRTTCPECGDKVFFIRFNGGNVWIDPPLGPPWYKHPCMDQGYIPSGRTRSSLLSDNPSNHKQIEEGLVLGVVKESEVSFSRQSTITCIETEKNDQYVLLVKFNAGFLTGKLVIFSATKKSIALFADDRYLYRVIATIDVPSNVKKQQEEVKCPECDVTLSPKNLKKHLTNQHFLNLRHATANKLLQRTAFRCR